jgi:hypothetical protein
MQKITEVIRESKIDAREHFKKVCQKKIGDMEKKILKRKVCMCPNCQKIQKYVKRGSRGRKLRTSEGEIEFKIKQIQCKECRKIFRPIINFLGLKPRQMITDEFLEKASSVAIHTSYQTSKEITETFTGEGISAKTIRKKILAEAAEIKAEQATVPPEEYVAILKDSTKGKTGKTKRGEDINIAFGVTGRHYIVNRKTGELTRPGIIGKILSVSVGDDKTFSNIQHKTKNIMTDGDRSIKNKAKAMKNSEEITFHRCHWHLPRMMGFALYNDGLKKKSQRTKFTNKLSNLIKNSFNNYEKYYQELIDECKNDELNKTVTYLKNAKQEFYNTKKNPIMLGDKPLLANSPVERVMREVDRRADIGSRWSNIGLEAITTVRLNHLYNKKIFPNNSLALL